MFAKLSVGKHVVSAKQLHGSEEPLFPLALAFSGLQPLTKVWVDYDPDRNLFAFKVNDADIDSLI